MSLPKIPAGICVAALSYGFSGPTGARRSDVAGGRGRYGLNYYGGTSQFAVTLILTPDQLYVWTLFYQRRIALGIELGSMQADHAQSIGVLGLQERQIGQQVGRGGRAGMPERQRRHAAMQRIQPLRCAIDPLQ